MNNNCSSQSVRRHTGAAADRVVNPFVSLLTDLGEHLSHNTSSQTVWLFAVNIVCFDLK